MKTTNVPTLKIHKLTQEQYDRELANGNIDENAIYLTPDEEIDLSPYATIEQLNGKANTSHGNHVPTTEAANNARFLRNDNTWQTVTPANIGAAAASHGTHVSYGTSATAVGSTASAGSASTVSRSDHTHSLSKSAVTTALGYTPPTTNTTYSAGTGISLSGTTFSNSGVRSIATGSSNGTISVNTNGSSANVAVKGLGSAAYTNSSAYAASGHTHNVSDISGAAITQAGSYTGTGTYNSGGPSSLTFSFQPKLIVFMFSQYFKFIYLNPNALTTSYTNCGFALNDDSTIYGYGKKSSDGKTIYWYNTNSAWEQLNDKNTTYYWIAFG